MDFISTDFSALILASGLSQRMGSPKAMLPFNNRFTFIEKIIDEYHHAGCTNIVCTINIQILPFCEKIRGVPGLQFVLNEHPEWGRMHSIKLGLEKLKDSEFCFIQNVDNPFITKDIILKIYQGRNQDSWTSPEFKGKGGHPVLISGSILKEILVTNDPNTTLRHILCKFPRKSLIMENDFILGDINTPDDYLHFSGSKKIK